MNDQWNNPAIIRQYVDGELDAEQTARFERALAERVELQQAVEFERQLRSAVSSAMSSAGQPTGALHDAVVRSLDEADAARAVDPEREVIGRIESVAVLRNPIRANIFAVAATLALVVGAILFGLFVPPIDQWGAGETVPVSQSEVPAYFSKEHCTSAAMGGLLEGGPSFKTVAAAEAGLSDLFGRGVVVFDLSEAHYEFVGAAPCRVCEGDDRVAGQMMYRRCAEGQPTAYASVFIVPVEYGIGLDADPLGWETAATLDECRTKVVRHRADGFVYYLTACDPRDFQLLEAELLHRMDLADNGLRRPPVP